MLIQMPATTTHRFALAMETERLGRRSYDVIDACAELAEPAVLALTPELIGDDPPLRAYVEQHSEKYRFDWVGFTCGFSGSEAGSIERAWLWVRLESDGQGPELPTALSMAPFRMSDKVKETFGLSFEVGINAGILTIGTGIESGEEVEKEHLFIAASGLSKPNSRWEFFRTAVRNLEGMFRLSMVVRSDRLLVPRGKVELTAEVLRRRYGIFENRSALDQPTFLTFTARPLT